MTVMLSKIFILLTGQPSETSSYLADMATEINGGGGDGGSGGEVHQLLKCQDVIISYEVNVKDFDLCLCKDKDFTLFVSHSFSFFPSFLPLSLLSLLLYPLAHCMLHCVGFVLNCIASLLKVGCMMVQDMALPLANLKFSPELYFPWYT